MCFVQQYVLQYFKNIKKDGGVLCIPPTDINAYIFFCPIVYIFNRDRLMPISSQSLKKGPDIAMSKI